MTNKEFQTICENVNKFIGTKVAHIANDLVTGKEITVKDSTIEGTWNECVIVKCNRNNVKMFVHYSGVYMQN